jgi:tRNA/tmRNA/rRNA uracil-C5-methylase (TrmA/RlmC/RlmD family)
MGRKKFNDQPFAYHQEIELEITTLTNLGLGLGRVPLPGRVPAAPGLCNIIGDKLGGGVAGTAGGDVSPPDDRCRDARATTKRSEQDGGRQAEAGDSDGGRAAGGGWVVMVPFTLPGERIRARVYRNHRNFSEADLVTVLVAAPDRTEPRCPLFGECGGCQYQHLRYEAQLAWKQRQVAELLERMAGIAGFPVAPVVASPREYGYRSKITPHFAAPARVARSFESGVSGLKLAAAEPAGPVSTPNSEPQTPNASKPPFPIGFLRQGTRFSLVDVPDCPIATDAINLRLGAVREAVHARAAEYQRGATLLLREASGEVTTDYDAVIIETIAREGRPPLKLHFLARDFFQNNPFILPAFTRYVAEQAAASGARRLVDAYCGSGLFALAAADRFEQVAGVEISETSVRFARENAAANAISNATFLAADAAAIFGALSGDYRADDTVVIIDPPRKGCDESFLRQLFAFGPRAVVYVSCDPATQMRDLKHFLGAGYALKAAQPFDLFPQTRHLECVLTLVKDTATPPSA